MQKNYQSKISNLIIKTSLLAIFSLSPVHADNSMIELLNMAEGMDRAEKLDLKEYIYQANNCTKNRNFSCSETNIAKASKYAKSVDDKKMIESARNLVTSEKKLIEQEEEQRQIAEAKRKEEASRVAEQSKIDVGLIMNAITTAAARVNQEKIDQYKATESIRRVIEESKRKAIEKPYMGIGQTSTSANSNQRSTSSPSSINTMQSSSKAAPNSSDKNLLQAMNQYSQISNNLGAMNSSSAEKYLCEHTETKLAKTCDDAMEFARSFSQDDFIVVGGKPERRNGRGIKSISACEKWTPTSTLPNGDKVTFETSYKVFIKYTTNSDTPCGATGMTVSK